MLKRAIDILVVLVGAAFFLPLLVVVAAAVRICIGTPVIFRQTRPGLYGRPFTLYKFRTMTDARDPGGRLLPDEQRLTRAGRIIRATSMDELPEILNILRGEMSLVGPRPLLMEYLPRYSKEQSRRHEVRPGITGWAQINGRNSLSWPEKFAMDVWYVENQSLVLDLKIILLTIWRVLAREGITEAGSVTVSRFTGNAEVH